MKEDNPVARRAPRLRLPSLEYFIFVIRLKRVYDTPEKADGARFLIERLWPRGLTKEKARLDGWLKDAAPSGELRSWYSHDPAKWDEFKRRYLLELKKNPEALRPLLDAGQKGTVTLVFAARNPELSNARVLKELLERKS